MAQTWKDHDRNNGGGRERWHERHEARDNGSGGRDHSYGRDRGGSGGRRDWSRERSRNPSDKSDAAERAFIRGTDDSATQTPAINPEIVLLRQLIEENRAEIARAYEEYQLTTNKRVRNYLRQQIEQRTGQVQKLQARVNSLS